MKTSNIHNLINFLNTSISGNIKNIIKMEQNIVEENTIQPIGNSNGKTLNIIGAFCDRWGFTGVASRFKSVLLNGLAKKGYGINYQILALPGGKGEYYIYKEEGGSQKMIFSNNGEHQKDGAIVGKNIDESNLTNVIAKIESA